MVKKKTVKKKAVKKPRKKANYITYSGVKFSKEIPLEKIKAADDGSSSAISPKEGKIKITCMIDADVYDALKALAKIKKSKYQTEMNAILRDALHLDKSPTEKIKEILEKFESKPIDEKAEALLDELDHLFGRTA